MKKSKSINDVKKILIENWFELSDESKLDDRSVKRLNGFVKSYELALLFGLNANQLVMLYYMFEKQDQDTDHLSCALGVSRRSAVNTANALVRKGCLWWDYPTGSNLDKGMDLMLERKKMITEEYMSLF